MYMYIYICIYLPIYIYIYMYNGADSVKGDAFCRRRRRRLRRWRRQRRRPLPLRGGLRGLIRFVFVFSIFRISCIFICSFCGGLQGPGSRQGMASQTQTPKPDIQSARIRLSFARSCLSPPPARGEQDMACGEHS